MVLGSRYEEELHRLDVRRSGHGYGAGRLQLDCVRIISA
jgi:hypothetical protein